MAISEKQRRIAGFVLKQISRVAGMVAIAIVLVTIFRNSHIDFWLMLDVFAAVIVSAVFGYLAGRVDSARKSS